MTPYPNIESQSLSASPVNSHTEAETEDWQTFLHSDTSSLQLPRGSFLLSLSKRLSNLYFKLYHRLEVSGIEHLPAQGPFIIAPNHQSFLDGPMVAAALPMEVLYNTYFFAKEEHVKDAVRKAYARNNNIILMERSSLRQSILKLAQVLRGGKNIVIFPEGVRTHNGKVGNFKRTFAILSEELNIPIIPVRISGAYEAWPRTSKFARPHKIELEYLPAVYPEKGLSYDELAERVKRMIEG